MLMGFAESDPTERSMVEAFRGALPKLGWTEGSNVRIEVRWGGYDADRIKMLAKELVDLRPDAIRALARETRAMFVTVTDPIGSGFAANLAHPGGNITGFTVDDAALGGKWLELLKRLHRVPRAWRSFSTRQARHSNSSCHQFKPQLCFLTSR